MVTLHHIFETHIYHEDESLFGCLMSIHGQRSMVGKRHQL